MPELYEKNHSLNQLEMKSYDNISRYCFCLYQADFPMKFGETHKYMSFKMYKILHEDNLPVGEVVTQARLHEGFINSSLMRILHEVHGLVTPYSPDIMLQKERRAKLYPAFSPQEYECLRNALGLITVNQTLDLEKAMKTLQWFKESTCPCTQHAVRRGGKQWQLRPISTVPSEVILQLPSISNPTILQRRKAKQNALDQSSLLAEASSISSNDTFLQDELENEPADEPTKSDEFNQRMTKLFQNPIIQQIFHDHYNIPVSSFDYMDGILGVFVPLFIRPSLQEPMYLSLIHI